MNEIRVSVIIPLYNPSLDHLEKALLSIKQQTLSNFECLLIDDGSEVHVSEFCSEFISNDGRFRILRQVRNLGISAACNKGIDESKGEFIARMDSDDISTIDRLSIQLKYLEENPGIHVVGSAVWQFQNSIVDDANSIIYYPLHHDEIIRKIVLTNCLAHPTVMFRKSFIQRGGYYNPSLQTAEDWDLWLRWMNRGAIFANLDTPLVFYRNSGEKVRNQAHWYRCVLVLLYNFNSDFILRRMSGIMTLVFWGVLPIQTKKLIYRYAKSVFRR